MGSSNFMSRPGNISFKQHSPLSALRNLSTTCEVTNRIDIDKYFEVLKDECTKLETNPRSPRRIFKRSGSSGVLETAFSPNRERRKRSSNLRKRISCDDSELFHKNMIESSSTSIGVKKSSFNYDLSGQIVDRHDEYKPDVDHCPISRQKSWDLSLSKLKGKHQTSECCSGGTKDLTVSYSEGDFEDFVNNNRLLQSKSCECISDLDERHLEMAMIHGKIYSVSDKNRKLRRKYFDKKEKRNSRGKTTDEDFKGIREEFEKKLSLV